MWEIWSSEIRESLSISGLYVNKWWWLRSDACISYGDVVLNKAVAEISEWLNGEYMFRQSKRRAVRRIVQVVNKPPGEWESVQEKETQTNIIIMTQIYKEKLACMIRNKILVIETTSWRHRSTKKSIKFAFYFWNSISKSHFLSLLFMFDWCLTLLVVYHLSLILQNCINRTIRSGKPNILKYILISVVRTTCCTYGSVWVWLHPPSSSQAAALFPEYYDVTVTSWPLTFGTKHF